MYNQKNPLGFIPKRSPRAKSPRAIRENVVIGEPSTRLPPPPKSRLVDYGEHQEEMEAREDLAQKEIEFKKTCTGVLYNKGGYQYISSKEAAKNLGK